MTVMTKFDLSVNFWEKKKKDITCSELRGSALITQSHFSKAIGFQGFPSLHALQLQVHLAPQFLALKPRPGARAGATSLVFSSRHLLKWS